MEEEQSPERRVEIALPMDRITLDASVDRVPQPKGEFKNLFQGTPPRAEGGDKNSENKGSSSN